MPSDLHIVFWSYYTEFLFDFCINIFPKFLEALQIRVEIIAVENCAIIWNAREKELDKLYSIMDIVLWCKLDLFVFTNQNEIESKFLEDAFRLQCVQSRI